MKCSADNCKKKVSEYNDFDCKHCNKIYCGKHRLPMNIACKDESNGHVCDTDKIKENHLLLLQKQNPLIIGKKLITI